MNKKMVFRNRISLKFLLGKIIICLAFIPTQAFTMPCDNGEQYICKSASGNYQVTTQVCMYDNPLILREVKINNVPQKIDLDKDKFAFWNDDRFLAFRYNKGRLGEGYAIVVEFDKSSKSGTLKYKYRDYNPSDWVTKKEETVSCVMGPM